MINRLKKAAALFLCVLLAAGTLIPSAAFRLDGETVHTVSSLAEGVTLTHSSTAQESVYGLQNFNVIEFDPAQKDLYLNVVGAGAFANDRATVSEMVRAFDEANPDLTPVAAVNGDLWMMGSAHARVEGSGTSYGGYSDPVVKQELTLPRGFNMYGGEIICSQYMYTETPYEGEFWSLGITDDGRAVIGCPTLDITASNPFGAEFRIDGLNRLPANDSLVLYSDRGCLSNYALDDAYELLIDCGENYTIRNKSTVVGTIAAIYDDTTDENPTISETAMILTARGSAISRVSSLKVGDSFVFSFEVGERYGRQTDLWDRVTDAVGGHMPFVVDGVKYATGTTKGYPSTIVGVKNDGDVVIIANDGRQSGFSLGLDFNDYASLTDELDINTGFILDGGGSTDMVVLDGNEYKVVNRPSDGHERRVINSLILSVGPAREKAKNEIVLSGYPEELTSLFFTDNVTGRRNARLVSVNIQSAVKQTAEGLMITADKYNGNVNFYLNYGLPAKEGFPAEPSIDEYPYIVIDMNAATTDQSPYQFQTVYVAAGDDRSPAATNFAGFNNVINDGKFHRYVIDTSAAEGITGDLHVINVGFLLAVNGVAVKDGDGIILRSVRLAKTADEAARYADFAFPYVDVPYDKWYAAAANYCYEKGYVSGTSDAAFSPDVNVTRAMFATILAKIDGADVSSYTGKAFDDVPTGKWYSAPVAWAASEGLAAGTGGGKFAPGDPVTRQQLATFLKAYADYRGTDTGSRADITGYSDYARVSEYAKIPLSWAVDAGIISGTGDGKLSPRAYATRAQVVQMVMKFTEKYGIG